MNTVICDVDRTLVAHGTERLFLRYAVKKDMTWLGNLLYAVVAYPLKECGMMRERGFKPNKWYLRERRVSKVEKLAEDFFEQEMKHYIFSAVLDKLHAFQEKGYKVLLLSGSIEALIKPLASYVGADFIATPVEVREGRYTGRRSGLHPYGRDKVLLLEDYARRHNIDLKHSVAFGDHITDALVFELVGEAYCVNPGPELKKKAKEKGWVCLLVS
ncbi:HAD-IB family hydrolase [Candidatus Woesearchaeota archaeon CG_4_10_14_0_8_um_filter_47_5]|nr:MAG: HAD-IB family hydrolase [Candidatus Woesearchaeota archaeon CG_4_10_14_0_8_um_filter_47_5]